MWKNRIVWLGILAAALVMYIFENNTGTRILLATLICMPLSSAGILFLRRTKLSAGLEVPETLGRGSPARCALLLGNDGRWSLPAVQGTLEIRNLLTGEHSRLAVTCAAGARRTERAAFSVEAAHCGRVTVQLTNLRLLDAFGLFARDLPCRACGTAFVLPVAGRVALSLADADDFLTDSRRYSAQKPGSDPSEIFRIREYAPGDPIRQIHWKLSQKTGAVLVRDFGLPVTDRMLLLLETTVLAGRPVTPEDMDGMLDLLFSVSRALLALGISHGVGWREHASGHYGSREIHSPDDLAELEEILLSNPIGPGESTVAGCYAREHLQCAYAHVAVIAPYLPPDISLLCHGNRVTALLPGGDVSQWGNGEAGVSILPIPPAELGQGELHLTL